MCLHMVKCGVANQLGKLKFIQFMSLPFLAYGGLSSLGSLVATYFPLPVGLRHLSGIRQLDEIQKYVGQDDAIAELSVILATYFGVKVLGENISDVLVAGTPNLDLSARLLAESTDLTHVRMEDLQATVSTKALSQLLNICKKHAFKPYSIMLLSFLSGYFQDPSLSQFDILLWRPQA